MDNFFNIPDAAAQNRLEIYGTKGCILANGTIGQDSTGTLKVFTQEQEKGYDATQKREAGRMRTREISPTPINIYRAEIDHFAKCLGEDLEPLNSGYEAIKNLKVVLAAYQSRDTGEKVKVDSR